jgi:hypothetical protein
MFVDPERRDGRHPNANSFIERRQTKNSRERTVRVGGLTR